MKEFSAWTPTREKVLRNCERGALTLMNLRGTPAARAERRLAAISPEAYIQAAGLLKHVCKMTGETPGAVCERLGIRGAHRTRLIPYGTGRFRLTKEQIKDSYRERDTRRGGRKDNDEEYWRRRIAISGFTEDEWRAKDRAFDKRIKEMRMASGPPNPARKIQQYADHHGGSKDEDESIRTDRGRDKYHLAGRRDEVAADACPRQNTRARLPPGEW